MKESWEPMSVLMETCWTGILSNTTGFDQFAETLRNTSWDDIVNGCGIRNPKSNKPPKFLSLQERTIICWAMGLTQRRNAVANIQEIVNLMLLRGQVGKPGQACVPFAGTAMCKGIARWVSLSGPRKRFWTDWELSSVLSRPVTMVRHGAVNSGDARLSGQGFLRTRWEFSFRNTRY